MIMKINSRTMASLAPQAKPYEVKDPELRGLGARVQPSGAISYFVAFERPLIKNKTRVTIGNAKILSAVQAIDEAIILLSEVARGIDPILKRRQAQQMLFRSFLESKYEPWIISHNKGGVATINMIRFAFKDLMSKNLKEITLWIIESWKAQRLKSGLKPSTVNRYLNAVRACLARAVQWKFIEINPLREIKKCKEIQTPNVRFLSENEETCLRGAMDQREQKRRSDRANANLWRAERGYDPLPEFRNDEYTDHLMPMILLSINLGVRRGELFSLQWSDVDIERRLVTIRAENTKSSKVRHLPLNGEAMRTLRQWQSQRTGDQELVFVNERRERFDNVNSSWERLLKDAKVKNFRWHDMRHHFASRLVQTGIDLNVVRELLGHSNPKMTLKYAHLAPSTKLSAVLKLDQPRVFETEVSGVA